MNVAWILTFGPLLPAQEMPGGDYSTILFVGIVIVVVYFFMWRPERKRQSDHKSMLENLKKNDKIMTAGGIHGIVDKVKDDEISIKVDEGKGVCLRVSKTSIAQVFSETSDKKSE